MAKAPHSVTPKRVQIQRFCPSKSCFVPLKHALHSRSRVYGCHCRFESVREIFDDILRSVVPLFCFLPVACLIRFSQSVMSIYGHADRRCSHTYDSLDQSESCFKCFTDDNEGGSMNKCNLAYYSAASCGQTPTEYCRCEEGGWDAPYSNRLIIPKRPFPWPIWNWTQVEGFTIRFYTPPKPPESSGQDRMAKMVPIVVLQFENSRTGGGF